MFTSFPIPENANEARRIQEQLRGKVTLSDDFGAIETIAGVDVGYDPKNNLSRASIALLNATTLVPIRTVSLATPTPFPYIPGLLSFREIPAILAALEQLGMLPDLLMVDGHGIAHPRRLGVAAHLGVLTGLPAIGVAKSRLCGRYDEPGLKKGDRSALTDKDEKIGTVLRSRDRVKPLFISPGHRIGHASALDVAWRCLTRYRLPEPTRLADKASKFN